MCILFSHHLDLARLNFLPVSRCSVLVMSRSESSGVKPASNTSSGPVTASERQKAAKEGALLVKQSQESALAALPLNRLYIGLWIRHDPPIANDFHWGFYYHKTVKGGTKYHMKGLGSGWIADHGSTRGVFKSQFLCVLIEIGRIPADKEGTLDQVIRSRDGSANDIPGMTCRVWLFTILPFLVQSGLVRCNDLQGLQQECFDFGNANMASAARNEQPRPVTVSNLCS